jgi:hypothetical protein
MNIYNIFKNSNIYNNFKQFKELKSWGKRAYNSPSPHFIKQSCILRNSYKNSTWVETGTFLGQTTQLISQHCKFVYSIEPEPTLFKNAYEYFRQYDNVEIINGLSEKIFPDLLPKINGDVNFWLDGHYSAGITFKGPKDTPILEELSCIKDNLKHFNKVCILIDDVRCFNPKIQEYSQYPSILTLIDWALDNNFDWHIEHDIFVAKNHS